MDPNAVVKADALFEASLGLALIAGGAAGALGPADFPGPVGKTVVVVVGCLLLGVAGVVARSAASAPFVRMLASANLATAAAALGWVLAATGFSAAGATVVAGTAAVLVCLAALQLRVRRFTAAARR